MITLGKIIVKFWNKIDILDLELIIAHELKKTREFVLAHPEFTVSSNQEARIGKSIRQRVQNKPLAYILGHKEFFGLDFRVNRFTLIPRPETELLVEKVAEFHPKNTTIIDVGTGSGNIIISLAKNLKSKNKFYAIDISGEALKIAKQNSKTHNTNKKIIFLKGNLLEPIIKSKNYKPKTKNCIIVANLPYLSKEIYNSTAPSVKKYEPKSALHSPNSGLDHYEKLFKQIKNTSYFLHAACYLEISPEQKPKIAKLIKEILPAAKTAFFRDLAGKWRICRISL